MRAPRHGWPWAVALVVAFGIGTAAGAYAWSARADVAEPPVELVAGGLTVQDTYFDESGAVVYQVTASLFNLADRGVTIQAARHTGWTVVSDQPATTVPARQWVGVPLAISPNCDTEPAPELRLDLASDGGAEHLRLPVRPQAIDTNGLHSMVCSGSTPRVRVLIDALEMSSFDDAIEMRVPLRAAGTGGDRIMLVGLDGDTVGFRAEGIDLPVELRPGQTETVTVRWSVEDCAATTQLGDVQLIARTDSYETVMHPLPARAVAALARLGVETCSA